MELYDDGEDALKELTEESRYDRYLVDGEILIPLMRDKNVIKKNMPAGIYHVGVDYKTGMYFEKIRMTTDNIIDLPDRAMNSVLKTVNDFWASEAEAQYKEYGITRKLGILLHGAPGTGKTILSARIAKEIIKMDGIVLFNPAVKVLQQALKLIRQIEPQKKVMVLFEEFDSTLKQDEQELLCLMDGETQVKDVVFIATTNYITRIPARFKARPSRFAKVIEIKPPTTEVREAYFNSIIKNPADRDKYLAPMVEASKNLSIDMCKDLLLSVLVFKESISDAVRNLKDVQKEHSQGVDDYNEENTKEIFRRSSEEKDDGRPLRGI